MRNSKFDKSKSYTPVTSSENRWRKKEFSVQGKETKACIIKRRTLKGKSIMFKCYPNKLSAVSKNGNQFLIWSVSLWVGASEKWSAIGFEKIENNQFNGKIRIPNHNTSINRFKGTAGNILFNKR